VNIQGISVANSSSTITMMHGPINIRSIKMCDRNGNSVITHGLSFGLLQLYPIQSAWKNLSIRCTIKPFKLRNVDD